MITLLNSVLTVSC